MPTYQYRCRSCGHDTEVVQSFSDPPLTECPKCGGELRKVFAPVGIVFKGSGFYKTDNRSGRSKAAASKDSKDSKDSKEKEPAAKESSSSSSGASTSDSKIA
jgi:putative FmdB family regulatory protein